MKNLLLLLFLVFSTPVLGQANYQTELDHLLESLNNIYQINYGASVRDQRHARVIYSAPLKALVFFRPSGKMETNNLSTITQVQVISVPLKDLHYKSAGIKEVQGKYFVRLVSRNYQESFEMAILNARTGGLSAAPNLNSLDIECHKPECSSYIQMIPAQIEALARKFNPNISPLEEVPDPFLIKNR